MSTQINSPATNATAKPVVAGIFNIVIGSCCLLGVLGLGIAGLVLFPADGNVWLGIPANIGLILFLVAIPLAALGVLSIFGGVCELRRRRWGWALAGSIAAAFVSTALGIASIVLTAVSKNEFAQ